MTSNWTAPVSSMPLLAYLDLHGNKLSGTLPTTSFSQMSVLTYLDLSANLISGTLPSTLSALVNLRCVGLTNFNFPDAS